jgi:hypothetical protein
MERYCAWCNHKIGDDNKAIRGSSATKDKQSQLNASHGICKTCADKELGEIESLHKRESFRDWLGRKKSTN